MKLSLLFQYLRLFEKGTAIRRLCVVLIGIVSAWGLAFSIMAFVPCVPVYVFWEFVIDPTLVASATCYGFGAGNDNAAYILQCASNMLFDLLIFAIPVTLSLDKTTPLRQRIGMAVLLLLGAL
jgi:hypothetical protein